MTIVPNSVSLPESDSQDEPIDTNDFSDGDTLGLDERILDSLDVGYGRQLLLIDNNGSGEVRLVTDKTRQTILESGSADVYFLVFPLPGPKGVGRPLPRRARGELADDR